MERQLKLNIILQSSVYKVKKDLGISGLIFFNQPDILLTEKICDWVTFYLVLGDCNIRHCLEFVLCEYLAHFWIRVVVKHTKEDWIFKRGLVFSVRILNTIVLGLDCRAVIASCFYRVVDNNIIGTWVFKYELPVSLLMGER